VAHGGLGGALVWPSGGPKWPKASCHVHLSLCVYICHLFTYFCSNFLHTNKTPCTSGTRWIVNINHHLCCCLLPFWCNVDGQNWNFMTVNKLPHTKPLLVPSKAGKQRFKCNLIWNKTSRYDANIKNIPSHTSYLVDLKCLPCRLEWLKSGIALTPSHHYPLWNILGVFIIFAIENLAHISPQMVLSSHSMVFVSSPRHWCFAFLPTSSRLVVFG
jgi:hypothetical protein